MKENWNVEIRKAVRTLKRGTDVTILEIPESDFNLELRNSGKMS